MNIRLFDSFQIPQGCSRPLSKQEEDVLTHYLPKFSFSRIVDSRGFIILGNGIDEGGYCYLTEEDLLTFMSDRGGALIWWGTLDCAEKKIHMSKCPDIVARNDRDWRSLTGREVELIWKHSA